jgi:Na+/H+ antiporter NhaD/arsenite permease-like protein
MEPATLVTIVVAFFLLGYAAIALERPIGIDKSASALLCAGLLWSIYALSADHTLVMRELDVSLAATAKVIFFLIGAMTIVEVVDAHSSFEIITSRIRTNRLVTLMWVICLVTFFLSAVLDNLTTTIIMISLIRKLVERQEDRLLVAGMTVISANAGGAWSPIGDVTTTMLWIGGQISTFSIMKALIVPSLVNLLVPLLVVSFLLRGRDVVAPERVETNGLLQTTPFERTLMFCVGVGILVCVPLFKAATGLPPFMGILFGLGIIWLIGDLVHRSKEISEKQHLTLAAALTRIDLGSIVFFIGILMAVAVLEHTHVLAAVARWLTRTVGRQDVIVTLIGLASSVVDNVPLVAASMGMYDLTQHPPDSFLWKFMAYCAGTGGSILIIGSAAGVAAMGLEDIPFFWYVKRISGLALLGYFAGIIVYLVGFSG